MHPGWKVLTKRKSFKGILCGWFVWYLHWYVEYDAVWEADTTQPTLLWLINWTAPTSHSHKQTIQPLDTLLTIRASCKRHYIDISIALLFFFFIVFIFLKIYPCRHENLFTLLFIISTFRSETFFLDTHLYLSGCDWHSPSLHHGGDVCSQAVWAWQGTDEVQVDGAEDPHGAICTATEDQLLCHRQRRGLRCLGSRGEEGGLYTTLLPLLLYRVYGTGHHVWLFSPLHKRVSIEKTFVVLNYGVGF